MPHYTICAHHEPKVINYVPSMTIYVFAFEITEISGMPYADAETTQETLSLRTSGHRGPRDKPLDAVTVNVKSTPIFKYVRSRQV